MPDTPASSTPTPPMTPAPPRVLVIGDAMVDSYKTCAMERISPEAPVPVLKFQDQFLRLGGAANMAAGVTAMGTPCDLMGLAGTDAQRDTLGDMLQEAGLGDLLEPVDSVPTIFKERILAMSQQVCRIDHESAFPDSASAALMDRAVALLGSYELYAVSDYDKGCTRHLQVFLKAARAQRARVLIDPKRADWRLYQGAWLIKPNWKEFQAAAQMDNLLPPSGTPDPQDHPALARIAQALMTRHDIEHLVVTLGADGYLHVTRDGGATSGPTKAREVFDLSGAGDSFLATLVAFMAQGESLERAIELGNAAAGVAVGHLGTSVVTRAELLKETRASNGTDATLAALKRLQAQGKRVVFTNGCFDLLHPGHLAILRQSKAAGDVLVVGVNSDASVSRLKGSSRPIVPLADRMTMLAGLKPVDFVVPFDEDTPAEIIRTIGPDVLVKGGDYTFDTIVGADFVSDQGGKVLIIPLEEGRSTSNIVARIASEAD